MTRSRSSVLSVNFGKSGYPNFILSGFGRDSNLAVTCNAGLVTVLELLTGEGEQDSAGAQVPEVAGESGESFLSQQLVHLAELLQFLVETEIVDRRISSKVTGCRTSQHTRKTS